MQTQRHILTILDYDDPSFRLELSCRGVGFIEAVPTPGWHRGPYYLLKLDQVWHSFAEVMVSPRYQGDRVEMCRDGQCTVGVGGANDGRSLDPNTRFDPGVVTYCAIGHIRRAP